MGMDVVCLWFRFLEEHHGTLRQQGLAAFSATIINSRADLTETGDIATCRYLKSHFKTRSKRVYFKS
jgi:hypothetical protein